VYLEGVKRDINLVEKKGVSEVIREIKIIVNS
jgi:hypothetical protein